jgi:hypothetical protein
VQSVLSLEVLEDGGEGGAEKRVTAPTSVFIRCTPQFERTKQIWCLRASNEIGRWTLWTVPVLGLSRQPMVLLGLEGGKEWNGAFQPPVGRGRHPSCMVCRRPRRRRIPFIEDRRTCIPRSLHVQPDQDSGHDRKMKPNLIAVLGQRVPATNGCCNRHI